MTEPVELPDVEAATTDRFSRVIAIAAVLATLAAAVVGYLNSVAAKAADRADVDAQQLAVQASSELARSREQAQVQYQLAIQRQRQLRNASSALEQLRFGRDESGRADALRLEQARHEKLAEETAEVAEEVAASGGAPVLDPRGPDGPSQDGLFPARYFSKSSYEGLRLTALRDAANEEGTERSGQVASYVVMLAMLAVAVYLFGFSLTPHGRPNRRLFAAVAAALSAIAVTWCVVVSLFGPERAPDEAADAYARGRIAYNLADYDEAVRRLDRAIALRPTFARAYQLRASAEFNRGSPQQSSLTSLTAPESLERAVADLGEARDLGLSDISLLSSSAFDSFLLGLEERSDERFEEAIGFAREAEAISPGNPVFTLNRAVAELAAGVPGAEATYREGMRKVLAGEDPYTESLYVSGALTDLELAATALGGDVAERAPAIKELLVGSAAADRVVEEPAGPERELTGLEVTMTPATAQVDVPDGQLDPDEDEVSLQWYQRAGELGWAVLPPISGPVEDLEWRTDTADGSDFLRRTYLGATAPPTCLSTTEYRVEVYVDGRLAGVGRSDPQDSLGDLTASVDTDIGYALCHPEDWTPVENPLPGLVNGYANQGSTRGVFVARISALNDAGAGSVENRARDRLESMLGLLFGDEAPQPLGSEAGAFLGLEGSHIRTYSFNGGGGVIRAGFGFDVSDGLFAALVFGEPDYMESDEAFEVLNSVAER